MKHLPIVFLAFHILTCRCAVAFIASSQRPLFRQRASLISPHASTDAAGTTDSTTLEEGIRSMRVKELKEELSKLNISTQDVFEKEGLVQRLLEARKNGSKGMEDLRSTTTTTTTTTTSSNAICAPLYFTSLNSDLRIAAVNMDGGITVNPSEQPYATIQMEVQRDGGGAPFSLRLLLDTACSGFVLRPSVVDQYNLPKLSTPVTMTSAGGTSGATGLTQLSRFSLGGQTFGPLPAAVTDIGALPRSLDGIVGLSFLSQFTGVDLDFETGQVSFYPKNSQLPTSSSTTTTTRPLVAQGTMELIPQLGIYTVDVYLGSRGPVKMLVDSGAAGTFLNWKGVEQLGISRNDDSVLQRLSGMAAMGSDNVAMQLTHRIHVSSMLKLSKGPGLSLKDSKRLGIDIGDIAILDSLRGQNVGGILGIDALMRCSSVRLIFQGPKKEILLFG